MHGPGSMSNPNCKAVSWPDVVVLRIITNLARSETDLKQVWQLFIQSLRRNRTINGLDMTTNIPQSPNPCGGLATAVTTADIASTRIKKSGPTAARVGLLVSLLLAIGLLYLNWYVIGYAASMPAAPGDDTANYQIYLPLIKKPLPPPVILQFASNVTLADPGDTITLTWLTAEADEVTLFHLLPTGQFGQFWQVETAGAMTYTIALSVRNQSRFMLTAVNGDAVMVYADVTVELTCPDGWFFAPSPDICPTAPALISNAAHQPFEQGYMLWVEETDLIYVLYGDSQQPQWQVFVNEWEEGDPIDDPGLEPPAGLYQPQRGFGLVWRERPQVRDRLGWALQPEEGYETAVQATSYPVYNDLYLLAVDNEVWRLGPEGSEWEKFNPIGEAQIVADLINQTRASYGLPPYQIDTRLNQAARRHGLDMALNNFTGHIGSDGSTPRQRMTEAGYNWQIGGEIIGWGFSGNHQAMLNWWMNSDIHRQMILSPNYEDFGLIFVDLPGSTWRYYYTVKMAKPLPATGIQAVSAQCTTSALSSSGGGASSWFCND